MKYSTLFCNTSKLSIAASLASTWVWAPALFVSSSIAYQYGILGLLIFLVPNIFTIILFGKVSEYYLSKNYISTYDSIYKHEPEIRTIQLIIGLTLLVCSTCVQLIGMTVLISYWFDIPKAYSCTTIILLGLLIVYRKGLQGVITSDLWKYFILLFVGIALCVHSFLNQEVNTVYVKNPESNAYLISFGITTFIGLLAAPYADQTFWSRAINSTSKSVSKTFNIAACMFALVPLCFGCIGLFSASNGIDFSGTWNITNEIGRTGWGILLGIGIFCALLSTVDSNLCGFHGLMVKNTSTGIAGLALIVFSIACIIIVSTTDITITGLFLIYGTIRTSAFIPALLVIFKRYSRTRLTIGFIISICLTLIVYPVVASKYPDYGYVVTIVVLLVPLIGYKR